MPRYFLKFEMGMSGTGLSTHDLTLDCTTHTDSEVRALVKVIVNGLFQTDEDKEVSSRYLKVIGSNGSIQWASRKIQKVNPDTDCFDIPQAITEE